LSCQAGHSVAIDYAVCDQPHCSCGGVPAGIPLGRTW
jgi:hypothetical protein